MRVVKRVSQMQKLARELRAQGEQIAFVPTMGYFHEGHLSLMRRGRKRGSVLVVSIFVNPLQFGPREDFARYPRDFHRDRELARKVGVDFLFCPEAKELYPEGFATKVSVRGNLTAGLCAPFRPGHFDGVATIVLKLFHIVAPDLAFFGQKDYQQFRVLEQMCRDLHLPIRMVCAPIVREKDGLALSSRNVYLKGKDRRRAVALYESLQSAKELVRQGERKSSKIRAAVRERLHKSTKVEYIAIVDAVHLVPVEKIEKRALLAIAARVGGVRLIDNCLLGGSYVEKVL